MWQWCVPMTGCRASSCALLVEDLSARIIDAGSTARGCAASNCSKLRMQAQKRLEILSALKLAGACAACNPQQAQVLMRTLDEAEDLATHVRVPGHPRCIVSNVLQ
jgi:hypothetical protein